MRIGPARGPVFIGAARAPLRASLQRAARASDQLREALANLRARFRHPLTRNGERRAASRARRRRAEREAFSRGRRASRRRTRHERKASEEGAASRGTPAGLLREPRSSSTTARCAAAATRSRHAQLTVVALALLGPSLRSRPLPHRARTPALAAAAAGKRGRSLCGGTGRRHCYRGAALPRAAVHDGAGGRRAVGVRARRLLAFAQFAVGHPCRIARRRIRRQRQRR